MASPRKISIYVPEDLVPILDGVDNASQYIAESIRLRRRHERAREVLREAGYLVTDAGIDRMRNRLGALDQVNADAVSRGEQ